MGNNLFKNRIFYYKNIVNIVVVVAVVVKYVHNYFVAFDTSINDILINW